MGTISVSLPADGETIDASDYNTPINTIVNDYNGNIDNSNIAAGAAIAGSKLADNAVTYSKVAAGAVVQVAGNTTTSLASWTTVLPFDNTIPQNTEGAEILTQAITPKATTHKLKIEVNALLSSTVASQNMTMALFQDSTADAIAVASQRTTAVANGSDMVTLVHYMDAGTTSSTTFKVRAGGSAAGTSSVNGNGAALYGAIAKSSIIITEYKA